MNGSEARSILDNKPVLLSKRGASYFAWCAELRLHGSGATADAALAALEADYRRALEFERASGLSADGGGGDPFNGFLPIAQIKKGLLILLVTGLIAMQLGYAVSAGINRALLRTFSPQWRDSLVESFENQLIGLGDAASPVSAERQQRLITVARAVQQRYAPVWRELNAASGVPPPGTPPKRAAE